MAYRNDLSGNNNFDSNCHGSALADGEYWIDNTEAGVLMNADNMSNPSANTGSSGSSGGDWNVGDVVVYLDSSGNVLHTATVVSSDASGTMVAGMSGGDASATTQTSIDNGYLDPMTDSYTVMRY